MFEQIFNVFMIVHNKLLQSLNVGISGGTKDELKFHYQTKFMTEKRYFPLLFNFISGAKYGIVANYNSQHIFHFYFNFYITFLTIATCRIEV